MKVLFLELVANVWHKWEIKEVSDSYARNFLIPKWLVKRLTPAEEKAYLASQKKQEDKRRENLENKHKILDDLRGKQIVFQAQTLENGKMFWWVKEADILSRIKKDFGVELERKNIQMPNGHIKKISQSDVFVKIGENMAKLTIIIQ